MSLSPVQAPDEVEHAYLSTGCLHGRHDYCASMTGYQGAKRPGVCKFCAARCTCPCHGLTDRRELPHLPGRGAPRDRRRQRSGLG